MIVSRSVFICLELNQHRVGGFLTSRGYRAAKTRPACARTRRDEVLVEEIKRIHAENYSVYGTWENVAGDATRRLGHR